MKYPIVILHGWGLSAKLFEPLARELRSLGYRVYVPDFPGFGTAAIPDKPLFLKDYVEFLAGYLKKRKLARAILIGHSFGGRVALKFTQSFPGEVGALILTGTPGYTPVSKKRLMLFIAIAKVGKIFFLIPFLNFFQEKVRRWYYFTVGARDYSRAEGFMRDTFKNVVREELVASMRDIHLPTLLVWGQEDIITPVPIAEKMKKTIQGSELYLIPKVGHNVVFKFPELFVSTITQWLKNV